MALRGQIQAIEQDSAGSQAAVRTLNTQLEEARIAAGLIPLTGTGIVLKLEDSDQPVPPGGNEGDYLVGANDLRRVADELWKAGRGGGRDQRRADHDVHRDHRHRRLGPRQRRLPRRPVPGQRHRPAGAVLPPVGLARLPGVRPAPGAAPSGSGSRGRSPASVDIPAFAGSVNLSESRAVPSPSASEAPPARPRPARGARSRDAEPALGSSAMRDRRSQVTIAAVAFLLGLLVVVQLRTQTGGSALQNKSAQDLTTLVGNLNTRNDQLRTEVGSLQGQLDELRADRANGATSVEQIQAELGRIRAWSGLDPGRRARASRSSSTGAIDADAVDDLLNELRNAGAEAIAVESVRVVPGTTVRRRPGLARRRRRPARATRSRSGRSAGRTTLAGSLTRAGGIVALLAATDPAATVDIQPSERPDDAAGDPGDLVPSHGHPRL